MCIRRGCCFFADCHQGLLTSHSRPSVVTTHVTADLHGALLGPFLVPREEGAELPTRGTKCALLCPTGPGVPARSTPCPHPMGTDSGGGGGLSRANPSHTQGPLVPTSAGVRLPSWSPGGTRGSASHSRAEESGTRPCALKRRGSGCTRPSDGKPQFPHTAEHGRLHGFAGPGELVAGVRGTPSCSPPPSASSGSKLLSAVQHLGSIYLFIYLSVRLSKYLLSVCCLLCQPTWEHGVFSVWGGRCHSVGVPSLLLMLTGAPTQPDRRNPFRYLSGTSCYRRKTTIDGNRLPNSPENQAGSKYVLAVRIPTLDDVRQS